MIGSINVFNTITEGAARVPLIARGEVTAWEVEGTHVGERHLLAPLVHHAPGGHVEPGFRLRLVHVAQQVGKDGVREAARSARGERHFLTVFWKSSKMCCGLGSDPVRDTQLRDVSL